MGLDSIKKQLNTLRDSCLESLSKTLEYSLDWQSNEDDYSREYAFNELLYNFQVYKRALDNFPKVKDETIDYVDRNIKELITDLSEIDFIGKYQIFLSEYFAKERYSKILNQIYDATLSNIDAVDDKTEEKAIEYFLIKDRLSLFEKNLSYFEKIDKLQMDINQTINSQYVNLNKNIHNVFDEYSNLWSFFSHTIKDERELLLIPNTKEYADWYKYEPLTSNQIENVFSKYAVTIKQNEVLRSILDFERINKYFKRMDLVVDQHVDRLIGQLRQLSSEFDDMISNIFNQPKVQPAFATYSKSENIDDIDLSEITNALISHDAIIDLLAEAIEKYDGNDEKKKELLMISYLLFQEIDKASKISGA